MAAMLESTREICQNCYCDLMTDVELRQAARSGAQLWVDPETQIEIVRLWPQFTPYAVTIGEQTGFMVPPDVATSFVRALARKAMM